MRLNQETVRLAREQIAKLNRRQVQTIYEQYGFAVYDSEKLRDLRYSLLENIKDKTIPMEALNVQDSD